MADDEKVRKLLQALLVVPEGELDDTHFDKLQSRLMRCCEPAFLPAFLRLGVLDTIQKGAHSQDYRIVSVCWRLLGKLCRNADMFGSLINSEHGHLFLSVFDGASSLNELEPFQKDSALHCLHDLAKVDNSREWVLSREDPTVVETIFRGMEHPSHFVSRSASRLLVLLVKKGGQGVVKRLEAMGLLKQLHRYLPDDCVDKQEIKTDTPDEGKHHMINLMVSLIKNPNSREFLRQQRLVWRALPYLFDHDRLVRSNFLEVLQIITKHGYHELILPGRESTQDAEEACSIIISGLFEQLFYGSPRGPRGEEAIFSTLLNRNNMQRKTDVITAVVLLASTHWASPAGQEMVNTRWKEISEVMVGLLGWQESSKTESYARVTQLLGFVKGFRSAFSLSFLNFLSRQVIRQSEEIPKFCDVGFWFTGLLRMLKEECFEDPRVIKQILDLLTHASPQFCAQHLGISADEEKETSNQGANEVFHTLLSLIEHTTDRAIVAAVLCLLRKLLATHSGVHTILTFTDEQSVGARLVKALQILLFDWNWELRESAVGFLAFIFGNEEQASAFSQFGYANNLHNALLQKLEDEEPYVRASALTALAGVCSTVSGWNALGATREDFPLLLIGFLLDSEAFVKREAVFLVKSWLEHTHGVECLARICSNERFRTGMKRILTDFDWEVKIKGIGFFALLLRRLFGIASEVQSNPFAHIFCELDGDNLLQEALKDYERLVRIEVAKVLQELSTVTGHPLKRKREDKEKEKEKEENTEEPNKKARMGEGSNSDKSEAAPELAEAKPEVADHQLRLSQFMTWVRGLDLPRIIAEADEIAEEDEFLIRHAFTGEDAKTVLDCPF